MASYKSLNGNESPGDAESPPPPDKNVERDASHSSIFEEVKAIRAESLGIIDFLEKVHARFTKTTGCTLAQAVVVAIHFAMFVIGVLYLDYCPAERNIPIFLVVKGAIGLVIFPMGIVRNIKDKDKKEKEKEEGGNYWKVTAAATISLFLLAWFFLGNAWVYRTYHEFSTTASDPNFCHPVLYWFAFWLITGVYITICFGFCCGGLCGLVVEILNKMDPR